MIAFDSCCWIEYFLGSTTGKQYAKLLNEQTAVLVPSIVLHEVFKKVMREMGEGAAIDASAVMKQYGQLVVLDEPIALDAARLALMYSLPMADSIIYATILQHRATLYTQDAHFEGLPQVKFFAKK